MQEKCQAQQNGRDQPASRLSNKSFTFFKKTYVLAGGDLIKLDPGPRAPRRPYRPPARGRAGGVYPVGRWAGGWDAYI